MSVKVKVQQSLLTHKEHLPLAETCSEYFTHGVSHLILVSEKGTIITPTLQTRKLRLREVKGAHPRAHS